MREVYMYLYEEKNKRVNLYDLRAKDSLVTFRKQEMSKIPEDKQIYSAYSTGCKVLESHSDKFDYDDLFYYGSLSQNFHREVHKFHEDFRINDYEDVISNYIAGDFEGRKPIIVSYRGDNRYFILTEDKYIHYSGYAGLPSCESHLDNIIQVSYPLYILQLLQRGDFCGLLEPSVVSGEYISSFLGKSRIHIPESERKIIDDLEAMDLYRFFELSRVPVKTFDRSLLDDILSVGLVLPQKDDALKQMRASNEVLKRMRERK